jgi:hypothetical protein
MKSMIQIIIAKNKILKKAQEKKKKKKSLKSVIYLKNI